MAIDLYKLHVGMQFNILQIVFYLNLIEIKSCPLNYYKFNQSQI